MSTHREHETLGFRAAPRLSRHHRHDDGANRYVVFAAGFVAALRITINGRPRMSYNYVRSRYPVVPIVGRRVRLENSQRYGTIAPEGSSALHYVKVRFDGEDHASPCHPTSLIYFVSEATNG